MIRDPLYQKILGALDGHIDAHLFELCAQDLLRSAYPSLTPMPGGDDAGYDGAIGTADGPFPLLCTTAQRPLRNLRRSLSVYVAKRQGPRRVVLATPRLLTNKQKRNLEDVALEDYAVQIVNIHDRTDFANRLYRHSEWRQELLGLSGHPSALSPFPLRSRDEQPALAGRDQDITWLRAQQGDVLIVGQPGIGKTYLHQGLVDDLNALFVVDEDPARLADALREYAPRVVIVDDAQDRQSLLQTLRRLRAELGFRFTIHTNCWPHGERLVRGLLNLPDHSVRRLEPLTRQDLLAVVNSLGIHGPDRLLHLLLDQAEGKPGLVVALAEAAKRGETAKVWSGEALAELLLHGRQLGSVESLAVLAALSLGGDFGLTTEEVAAGLGITPVQVRSVVTNLAAGGVVEEVDGGPGVVVRMSVRPEVLRGLLVRDVFFKGPAPISDEILLARLRSERRRVPDLARTLISARQRGAEVPPELLIEIARDANDERVWCHLSHADTQTAELILSRCTEVVPIAADGLLRLRPEPTLRLLLQMAADDDAERREKSRTAVKEWVQGDEPGDLDSLRRRRLLLGALRVTARQQDHAAGEIHDWAVAVILAPNIDTHGVPPGNTREITVYFGIRSLDQLREIAGLWPEVLDLCRDAGLLGHGLRQAVEDWCYPQRHGRGAMSEGAAAFMRTTARQMVNDAQAMTACRRAARTWLRDVVGGARLNVMVPVDRIFHRLFGRHDGQLTSEVARRRRRAVLEALADRMGVGDPGTTILGLASMEHEAAAFQMKSGWDRHIFYDRLARAAERPIEWLRAGIEHGLPSDRLQPFAERAARESGQEAERVLTSMMGLDAYRSLARHITISMPEPTDELLDIALDGLEAPGHQGVITLAHLSPAERTMQRLLRHQNREVRVHAALAEWQTDQEGTVRPTLEQDWRRAILESRNENEYFLGQILSADSTLAFEWAMKKIDEAAAIDEHFWDLWRMEDSFAALSTTLDPERRWELLEKLGSLRHYSKIVDVLMQADEGLFRRWVRFQLSREGGGKHLALRPLNRRADDVWERFAVVAADEGVSPEELAGCVSVYGNEAIVGPFSNYYLGLVPGYERLASHDDQRLRPAGRRGLELALAAAQREQRAERLEAVRGRL